MKKILIVLLASVIAVAGLALNVQAANVSFAPRTVKIKVMPGDSVAPLIRVNGFWPTPYSLNLRIGSRMAYGRIPQGWITPANLLLASRTGGASSSSVRLSVNIPPGTMAGMYSGLILPESMQSSQPVNSQGVIVAIEVVDSQAACSGLPVFSDFKIMPESFWAPTDRDVEIDISGAVTVADGCGITAGYTLESNNGLIQGNLTLTQDGNFSERLMANISRSGKDKDGKVFNGKLFAIDEEGNEATLEFYVTALHDKGIKKGQNK